MTFIVKMWSKQLGRALNYAANRQRLANFNTISAITRDIDKTIVDMGLVMHKSCAVNLDKAIEQHHNMINILKSLGIKIHNLPSDGFPDSVFIEDTAVIIDSAVLITRPGARSRLNEIDRVRSFFKCNEKPFVDLKDGYVDGGDVLFTGSEILVGLSARTNRLGIKSLAEAFPNYTVHVVDLDKLQEGIPEQEKILHLKSCCSMCGPNTILVGGKVGRKLEDYLNKRRAMTKGEQYNVVFVPDVAAANCVYVNETIIRRANEEFPASGKIFETSPLLKNVKQIEIRYNELAKVDGALTCCSLLSNMHY